MSPIRKTTLLLLAADFVATIIVFNLITQLRGVPAPFLFRPLLGPAALLMASIYLIDGYRARTNMAGLDYTSQHVIAVLSALIVTLLLTYVLIPHSYELQSSRSVIVFSFVALLLPTLGIRRMVHRRLAAGRSERSFLFLGGRASREAFRAECQRMGVTQPVIFSSLGSPGTDDEAGPGEQLRSFDEAIEQAASGRLPVEAIILRESNRELPPDAAQRLVQLYFSGIPTYTLELFHQVHWQKIPLYRLNPTWLFQEGFQITREPVFERLKRSIDVGLSAIGLVVAAPLIAAAGLAIWIEDRGPVFFQQTRIGQNQVRFRAWKLRSMRGTGGDPYTQPGDARITRIGRFLRAGRLDELPQLWNVLRGEMSLIGPRAEWDRLAEEYQRQIPGYNYRHLVKPGITGWAQVNFTYGASLEDAARKLEYDLYYIRHFSFLLDASIAMKTIQVILFGKGR